MEQNVGGWYKPGISLPLLFDKCRSIIRSTDNKKNKKRERIILLTPGVM